jgi:acetyltransferase-like isoleucine patch superfamily enzyme
MITFLKLYIRGLLLFLKLPKIILETKNTQTPVTFKHWFNQYFLAKNLQVYWPIDKSSIVRNPRNVYNGVESCPGYEKGCYIQAINPIYIGNYTQIANNVGIISSNHDLHDLRTQIPTKPIYIGNYCWLGMNSVILPEVTLGDFTIVGAGSVVTKSFVEGYCVIAGNPAKIIKMLDKEKCIKYNSKMEYNGFFKLNEEFNINTKRFTNLC